VKAVLTYHSIDDSGSPISVSPKAFDEHLRWLAGGAVRVLSLEQIASHPADGADAVAVTFDDGFLNTREPILRLASEGILATLFVVTARIGLSNSWRGVTEPSIPTLPLLDWSDIEMLMKQGVSVAPHTRTHRHLSGLSSIALDDELLGSREDLEGRLGVRGVDIAYPYGAADRSALTRAGQYFRRGYTTEFRTLKDDEPDAFALPRIDMYYFNAPGALAGWSSPRFMRRLKWIRARRRIRRALRASR
jgi:peptidoglycan/xylan/chitin deacetylase (PgdA/CDA1 family)